MKVLSYDPELCVGCYICEEVCSDTWFKVTDAEKSSIRIHDDGQGVLSAVFCNQCGECIEVCPTEALSRISGASSACEKSSAWAACRALAFAPTWRCTITATRPSLSSASPAASARVSARPMPWLSSTSRVQALRASRYKERDHV